MNRRHFLLGVLSVPTLTFSKLATAAWQRWCGLDLASKGVMGYWISPEKTVPISSLQQHNYGEQALRSRGWIDDYCPQLPYPKDAGVRWGGQWWMSKVDNPTDRPGISDQWRLIINSPKED